MNDIALPAIGLVAPDMGLFAMQQFRQNCRVGHVGRRRYHRVHQLALAVHADMRLHPEVPLLAFARLVHLRVTLLLPILGRTGRVNDGRVHNRACRNAHSALLQVQVDGFQNLAAQSMLLQKVAKLAYGVAIVSVSAALLLVWGMGRIDLCLSSS